MRCASPWPARACCIILHIEAPETEEDDWDRFPHVREMLARWRMIAPTATRAEAAEQLGVKFVKAAVEFGIAGAWGSPPMSSGTCATFW